MLETQRGNYDKLVSISTIDFIGPLVLIVGLIVILYGVLMLVLARRLSPGRSRRSRNVARGGDRMSAVLLASTGGWQTGIALGIVVIAVAAVIVIVIVVLAIRIAKQAKTAEQAVEVVRTQTTELPGVAQINDSGVRILHAARALRKVAVGK